MKKLEAKYMKVGKTIFAFIRQNDSQKVDVHKLLRNSWRRIAVQLDPTEAELMILHSMVIAWTEYEKIKSVSDLAPPKDVAKK